MHKHHWEEQEEIGKSILCSIPYHELNLIEDMDELSHLERCSSRSQYLRRLVKRNKEEWKLRKKEIAYA